MRWVCVVALTLTGVAALGTPAAFAKSYEMTRVWIDATVAPDGSMTVIEERTYDFTGDYTFAFWELDKGGADGLDVLGMSGPRGVLQDERQRDRSKPHTADIHGCRPRVVLRCARVLSGRGR